MERIKKYFHWGAHIAAVIYIIFLQMCAGTGSSRRGDKACDCTVVDIRIQKKPKYFPVYTPYPVEVIVPGPSTLDSIPYTDSTYCKQLAKAHYTTKVYSDTLHDDTVDIYINDTLVANALKSRVVGYKIKQPFTTVVQDRFMVMLVGNIGTDLKGFVAGPQLVLKGKRGFIYSAGVDFNTTGNIVYRLGFGVLIRFKKRVK